MIGKGRKLGQKRSLKVYINHGLMSVDCECSCNQLQSELNQLVKDIETKKTISPHSKPWMNQDISKIIDELRVCRKRFSRHRSARNSLILKEKREEVGVQLALARKKWILEQSEKIPFVSEKEKWKIINDLTNSSPAFNVQPIAEEQDDGSTKYLFEDNEILGKMEQYHVVKNGLSDINRDKEELNTLIEEAKRHVNAPGIMNNPISVA